MTAPKTALERMNEMEKALENLTYVVQYQAQALQELGKSMSKLLNDANLLSMTVNSIIKLSEENKVSTTENVVLKMQELETEALKLHVKRLVETGTLVSADSIEDAEHAIVYKTSDISYGLTTIADLADEELKTQIIGKKAGDVVNNLTIVEVYKRPAPSTQE